MGRPKKIKCIPEGIWSLDGITFFRNCPYCFSRLEHKNYGSALSSFNLNRGCICKSAWSKGLTKDKDERLKIAGNRVSNTYQKQIKNGTFKKRWNAGLTKKTNSTLKNMSIKSIGKKHTQETKNKIAKTSIEHWKNEEYRNKVIEKATIGLKKAYAEGRVKAPINKDTVPELLVEAALKDINIKYVKQFPLVGSYPKTHLWTRFYDFYLPNFNLLVEVHGDYWHGKKIKDNKLSKIQEQTIYNDAIKKVLAINCGYNIDYIWESETKNKIELHEKISKILCSIGKLALRLPNKTGKELTKY